MVVDASVARAAGSGDDARASVSRQLLEGVLEVCHHAAFCPQVFAEWRKHRSGFAREWLTSMFARRKVESLSPCSTAEIESMLDSSNLSESKRSAVAKDAHLLAVAKATSALVATLDCTLVDLVRELQQGNPSIHSIAFLDLQRDSQNVLAWIQRGD